nr:MAG TPA: hypothetical protein [Caudoviricetes sp.]
MFISVQYEHFIFLVDKLAFRDAFELSDRVVFNSIGFFSASDF